jgi:predicted ATPase
MASGLLTSQVFSDVGVSGAVSRVLGILEEEHTSLSQTIARQLASQKVLLVLDNCEQVLKGSAEFAEEILSQAPDAKVLATSREPLHVGGELVRQVHPLNVEDGIQLFLERARHAGSEIVNEGSSGATIRSIVERLDGGAACDRTCRSSCIDDGSRSDASRSGQTI